MMGQARAPSGFGVVRSSCADAPLLPSSAALKRHSPMRSPCHPTLLCDLLQVPPTGQWPWALRFSTLQRRPAEGLGSCGSVCRSCQRTLLPVASTPPSNLLPDCTVAADLNRILGTSLTSRVVDGLDWGAQGGAPLRPATVAHPLRQLARQVRRWSRRCSRHDSTDGQSVQLPFRTCTSLPNFVFEGRSAPLSDAAPYSVSLTPIRARAESRLPASRSHSTPPPAALQPC